ncbi:rhodanese-like domain-containing protein [Emticicia sp. BO119]|uniref:rhodanese-like domain-containing protein n=1 Tax=Emticicia sp. BO119 TaxID=2757768 RepID=UPI0015F00F60|nr:rhodanese-like domain-containing protein [Emticicia sp. BO119]MBA4854059.1 conjugal transfer protein TraF [Emticicia sp. BO119]
MKFLFSIVFILTGLSIKAQNKDLNSLNVDDFDNKIKVIGPTSQLVDVRTPSEFVIGHIKRAVNINFTDDDFEEVAKKRLDKTKPVFLYCFSGKRSADAAAFLRTLGFKEVYDLNGGFAQWTASSKPYVSSTTNTKPIAALTLQNLDDIVKANEVVLILFYTEWCDVCKKMTPMINKIADENKQIKLLKVDSEKNDIIASVFKVEENPTYIIIKKGRRTWSATGEISEQELKDVLLKLNKI